MNLSTKSRYGARILIDIALNQSSGPVQNADIAKRQGISVQYVVQLIRLLKNAKLITTARGPKGGHILSKDPQEITCGELVRFLETHSQLVECGDHNELCTRAENCQIRLVWMDATQAMFQKLDSVTIADLVSRTRSMDHVVCPKP